MTPNTIVGRGGWCAVCTNKTEKILLECLCKLFGKSNVQCQYVVKMDNMRRVYDFKIDKYNILIELDGRQHFTQVQNWDSPEYNLNNDIMKINHAIENDYTIIHLLQTDVFNNLNDWKNKLIENIQKHDKPKVIILNNSSNIYKNHIQKLTDDDYDCNIVKKKSIYYLSKNIYDTDSDSDSDD